MVSALLCNDKHLFRKYSERLILSEKQNLQVQWWVDMNHEKNRVRGRTNAEWGESMVAVILPCWKLAAGMVDWRLWLQPGNVSLNREAWFNVNYMAMSSQIVLFFAKRMWGKFVGWTMFNILIFWITLYKFSSINNFC